MRTRALLAQWTGLLWSNNPTDRRNARTGEMAIAWAVRARDANPEVLNLEVRLTLDEVIQPVEGADRVGVAPYTGGITRAARRAGYLACESGSRT